MALASSWDSDSEQLLAEPFGLPCILQTSDEEDQGFLILLAFLILPPQLRATPGNTSGFYSAYLPGSSSSAQPLPTFPKCSLGKTQLPTSALLNYPLVSEFSLVQSALPQGPFCRLRKHFVHFIQVCELMSGQWSHCTQKTLC